MPSSNSVEFYGGERGCPGMTIHLDEWSVLNKGEVCEGIAVSFGGGGASSRQICGS